jgi:uncharacterized membrane protein YgcG
MAFKINTTGISSPIIFYDLGERTFNHPTNNYDLELEFTKEEIRASTDIQNAINNNWITVYDEHNNLITSTNQIITHSELTNLNNDDHLQYPLLEETSERIKFNITNIENGHVLIYDSTNNNYINSTGGLDGTSGTSGSSGTSGINGISGTSGSSGTSGIDGTSGSSGTSSIGYGIYAYAKTDADGTLISSNGLTVNKTNTGVYEYTLTQPYNDNTYAVVGNPILTVTDTNIQISNINSSSFIVTTGRGDNGSTSDTPVDTRHSIVVFGVDGPTGLGSAYQSWLAVGNTGTENDFVNSLNGTSGTSGSSGTSGNSGTSGSSGSSGTSGSTPVFGTYFQSISSENESSTTSSSYQQKVRLTTSNLPKGIYRIGFYFETRQSNASDAVEVRIQENDTYTIANVEQEPDDYRDIFSYGGFIYRKLEGINYIDIDWRQQRGSTAYIRRARLEIWRVE